MKLEVGMYVRSKINGLLSKITDIEQFEELGQIVKRYILDNNYNIGFCSTEKDSVIASHNIIDLIEVGDILYCEFGGIVSKVEVLEEDNILGIGWDNDGDFIDLESVDIKTIVTKEQFESMQYEVK